jgi:alpha-D-xyloside xylohydrolase
MHWDDGAKTLTIGARAGSFPGMLKERTFNVVVGTGAGKAVRYLGEKVVVGEAVN